MGTKNLSARDAADAAAVLSSIAGYEEPLTAKAAGMTSMIWGLVTAGIFLTYAAASPPIEAAQATWIYSLIWVPWVAAGMALSGALWNSHAISLRQDPEHRRGFLMSLGLCAVFFAIMAAAFLLVKIVFDAAWTTSGVMILVNGLFTLTLGTLHWRNRMPGGRITVAAGIAVVVAGFALAVAGTSELASGLAGSAIAGFAWFGTGLVTYFRG